MKKLFVMLLVVIILVTSIVSCQNKNSSNETPSSDNTDINDSNTNLGTDTDASTLLNNVWATYKDEEKFSAVGGDYDHPVDAAPGAFDLSDTASLASMLILPESVVADIDDAASLIHMMNANTFTCGMFHVTDSEKVTSITETLRDAIRSQHWMCGFPDKFVIITYGQYVVSVFGNEELVNNFRDKFHATYAEATIAFEEAIS